MAKVFFEITRIGDQFLFWTCICWEE